MITYCSLLGAYNSARDGKILQNSSTHMPDYTIS